MDGDIHTKSLSQYWAYSVPLNLITLDQTLMTVPVSRTYSLFLIVCVFDL